MDEYNQLRALRWLIDARELMVDDMRPEAVLFNENVEGLVSYLSHHGDPAVKDLIKEVWG